MDQIQIPSQVTDWKPQPKQALALERYENEILYGGARGGGKTDAGQSWLLYDINKPRYRALVVRRNAIDLTDWIDRARVMFARSGGRLVGTVFIFPGGARIRTGHLKDDNAFSKYQGHEYQKILLEELTHIANENDYEKLRASCRSTVPGITPQIFATTNPDGPGRKWVKKRWSIPDMPDNNKIYTSIDPKTGLTRVFIPSRLEDNTILNTMDPMYRKVLESIEDDELREAWLDGSWMGFGIKGAYYKKQMTRAWKERRITSVPHDPAIPVYTWWDLGVSDSMVVGFFQFVGQEIHVIDYHEDTGEGIANYAKVLKDKSDEHGYIYKAHFAPHDIMARELTTGVSRYETAKKLGITFETRYADNGRDLLSAVPMLGIADGIDAMRNKFKRVWIDEKKCERLIECLTNYQKEWNDKMGEFKATALHDQFSHAADMMRYMAVTPITINDQAIRNQQSLRVHSTRNAKNAGHE